MKLEKLEINGLFKQFNHNINLGKRFESEYLDENEKQGPTLSIIHGPNGVGKTTILKMLDGLFNLDFNIFRIIPFRSFELFFNDDVSVRVFSESFDKAQPIHVIYKDNEVLLNPVLPGPTDDSQKENVDRFREIFKNDTRNMNFSFINSNNIFQEVDDVEGEILDRIYKRYGDSLDTSYKNELVNLLYRRRKYSEIEDGSPDVSDSLAKRIISFIRRAQVNYRPYFRTKEPELFDRILERLTSQNIINQSSKELSDRLLKIQDIDNKGKRLGLQPDRWDIKRLTEILENPNTGDEAFSVIGAYIDTLESRCNERKLVADRLFVFEKAMNNFFIGKTLEINLENGFKIISNMGDIIHEKSLSRGEYSLLYLMVSALVTRRKGTIIAIDEPELSMHIAWQKNLIQELINVSSGAEPQFILATHSPDLVAKHRNYMNKLVGNLDGKA